MEKCSANKWFALHLLHLNLKGASVLFRHLNHFFSLQTFPPSPFTLFCRPSAQRAVRQQPRSVLVRRQPVARFRRDAHPELPDQADADLVQAPPAADDEVVLCHQPEPGRQGPQAAGPEDGPLEAGAAGEVANNSVCQFDVY